MGAYTLSATMIGADQLKQALSNASSAVKQPLADAVNKGAIDVREKAVQNMKDSSPTQLHKSGALWSSMNVGNPHSVSTLATPDSLQAVVGTNLEYAQAQEKGTEGMTINVPSGRRIVRNGKTFGQTKPYSFKGNIKPKFFLKQAMEDERPIFNKYIQQAAQKIVSTLAGK